MPDTFFDISALLLLSLHLVLMAVPRILFLALLLSLLACHLVAVHVNEFADLQARNEVAASATTIDCAAECRRRCSLASRHKICLRACGTCCARCNCVPPGTSGNQNLCPCYAKQTTHGGRKKCP